MKIRANFLTVIMCVMAAMSSFVLFNTGAYEVHSFADTALAACGSEEIVDTLASGTTTGSTSYNTYLEAYFTNLTENFGYNYKGSCGYIAMGMILSYFDNYYSDNIIPEKYDVISVGAETNMNDRKNSPGVMNDNYLYEEYGKWPVDVTADEYYYYLREYENYSFHAKLILYANWLRSSYNFDDDENPCATSTSELTQAVHYYLYSDRGYKPNVEFFITTENRSEAKTRQFIIDSIERGLPVFTFLTDDTALGHFAVAYAYDASGTIYFHSGWHGYSTRLTVSDMGYKKISSATTIEFVLSEHVHSDNYAVTNGRETKYYCYCCHDIVTYKPREHTYIKYEKSDASQHIAYCECGATTPQKHTWASYTPITALNNMFGDSLDLDPLATKVTYVRCTLCGFIKKQSGLIPVLPPDF